MALTLFICGNVGLNPAPKNTKSYYFSLFHWNLKSLPPHDFSKLSLMEAYSTNHKFNMICLSETYLDSSDADDDDTRLNSKDFSLIREDNLHSFKRCGVNIYFKEHLGICLVSPLNLNECLVLEINKQNKKRYVASLY